MMMSISIQQEIPTASNFMKAVAAIHENSTRELKALLNLKEDLRVREIMKRASGG